MYVSSVKGVPISLDAVKNCRVFLPKTRHRGVTGNGLIMDWLALLDTMTYYRVQVNMSLGVAIVVPQF